MWFHTNISHLFTVPSCEISFSVEITWANIVGQGLTYTTSSIILIYGQHCYISSTNHFLMKIKFADNRTHTRTPVHCLQINLIQVWKKKYATGANIIQGSHCFSNHTFLRISRIISATFKDFANCSGLTTI